jgi:hypothetical protein
VNRTASTATHPVEHYEEQTPTIERLEVVRVTFRRGKGCCEKSIVRMVTAYFDLDGTLLVEVDPMVVGDKTS